MPGDFGDLAVNTRVHTPTTQRTRGCGCAWHPAFPTPLFFQGRRILAPLGRIAPRECETASTGLSCNFAQRTLLTFPCRDAISTPPGTSGLLAFELESLT